MKNKVKFILPLVTFIVLACTNVSESDLINEQPNEVITYNANIKPLIDSNCLSCHSDPPRNGAPFPLTNFEQVSVSAENGSLLSALNKQTGETGAMPPSGRLPQPTIDLIAQWIEDGQLEE
jgi:mono/diheme cytochrome c family protein